ncbi:hypothetical protein [Sinomonas halotolerans]|uniref:Secreted protein n=1 Tax=Sinomonas halotolerans TaxID=1644133 RepID=A0ABU9WZ69_9MICC
MLPFLAFMTVSAADSGSEVPSGGDADRLHAAVVRQHEHGLEAAAWAGWWCTGCS